MRMRLLILILLSILPLSAQDLASPYTDALRIQDPTSTAPTKIEDCHERLNGGYECVPRDDYVGRYSQLHEAEEVTWGGAGRMAYVNDYKVIFYMPVPDENLIVVPEESPGVILEAEGGKRYKIRNTDGALTLKEVD